MRRSLRIGMVMACAVAPLRAGDTPLESPVSPVTAAVLESEQLLEKLRVPLAALSHGVRGGELPGARARAYLAPSLRTVDLGGPAARKGDRIADIGAVRRAWRVASEERQTAAGELSLWRPLLDTIEGFRHFGFYNIRGAFGDELKSTYDTVTGFKGLATLRSGRLAHVTGKVTIRWERSDAKSCADVGWRIAALRTEGLRITETAGPLFEDGLARAVSAADRKKLERSKRDEGLIEWIKGLRGGKETFEDQVPGLVEAYRKGELPVAMGQVSVVDINGDGHDDFYVTASTDRALLYRNRGDGTFEEIGADLGLDLEGVHAAVFADFDNDGDKDAFVSYLAEGVRHLRNENGRFSERSVSDHDPGWVVAFSVVDYDNDGLLDVYCGAWAGEYIGIMAAAKEKAKREGKPVDASIPGLADAEAKELTRRLLDPAADPILTRPGPPNILLKNVGGGRFVRARRAGVEIYYNTLATTWSDIDRDGDLDLYVTNEAGPNQLLENRGDGTFRDISDEVTGEYGYGMGASWGDYDNDGRPDLYVTNMYSKAGIRIAEQFRASAAVKASARGNSLIKNRGGRFERVGGSPTTAADFGWGGAFADLNNDGRLDIYAPAGYVTMPEEVAQIGDT